MFKQLAHICIGADDLDAAEHFYCDILGMERESVGAGLRLRVG